MIPTKRPAKDAGRDDRSFPLESRDQVFGGVRSPMQHGPESVERLIEIVRRLRSSVTGATGQRLSDVEIDQLLAKAEDFVSGALREGHEVGQQIVTEAEIEGMRIVTSATTEAQKLIDEGRRFASGPFQTVEALRSTVSEFAQMNLALVQELATLSDALLRRDASRSEILSEDGSVTPISAAGRESTSTRTLESDPSPVSPPLTS